MTEGEQFAHDGEIDLDDLDLETWIEEFNDRTGVPHDLIHFALTNPRVGLLLAFGSGLDAGIKAGMHKMLQRVRRDGVDCI